VVAQGIVGYKKVQMYMNHKQKVTELLKCFSRALKAVKFNNKVLIANIYKEQQTASGCSGNCGI